MLQGHLAPDAAFVYNALQDATYYFFNVAPQFQSFNNGNWKALEINTRQLAEQLGRDLGVGSRPTDQPTSRSTDQKTSSPAHQQTNRPIDQPTNRPTDQQTSQPTDQNTSSPANQQTNRPTDQ